MSAPLRLLSIVAGQQTFDGLGRQLSVTVSGRATQYEYISGQMPPSANVLPDGKRIDYTYEPQLDHALLSIVPVGEAANTFTFSKPLALPESSTGPLGVQRTTYTLSGQPKTDTWTLDDKTYVTTWRHALSGLLLGFDDADGVTHERKYDRFGRLEQVKAGEVLQELTYDEFDRPASSTTLDLNSGDQLVQTLTYDAVGREHTRTFAITQAGETRTVVQTLGYSALDQLTSRQWKDGSKVGEETFDYDIRGRLITYTANATAAPTDPLGNKVTKQAFELNALDGYEKVISTFADGSTDTASFTYAADDPTQVSSIAHTHPSWPARIDLTYDPCGRVTKYVCPASANRPALDRTLTWDAQDRLIKVDDQAHTCVYGYDPSGQLSDRVLDGVLTRSFFSGGQPTHEHTGSDTLRLHEGFALSKLAAGVHQLTTLLGTDAQGSVRIEADSSIRSRLYTAHGSDAANDQNGPYGFAGERREALTGWYIPSGYRPYDPIVMGFLSPDSDCPFGQGGLNSYAYCAGDPVNRIDPSGHGWLTWLVAGVGIGLGVLGLVASFGLAAPVFGALAAGGIGALTASGAMAIGGAALSAISLGTGIASTVLEATDKDSKAASILGWVSFGTGLAGAGLEMGAARMASAAAKTQRLAGRASNKASKGVVSSKPATTGPSNYKEQQLQTLIYESKPGSADVRLHPNYLNSGYPGFETHGMPGDVSSKLWNSKGVFRPAKEVALEMESWLRKIDYPAGEPFILVACNGGSSGAATKVATVTQRTVISFKKTIHVDPHPAQFLRDTNATTNHPLALRSFRKMLTSPPSYYQHRFLDIAEMDIYLPK